MGRRASQTPSQTVGPFFGMALGSDGHNVLADDDTPGDPIRLQGLVLDGDGDPVEDALVELWQADAAGRYLHPRDRWPDHGVVPPDDFIGFGRCPTAHETGRWWFDTVRPGPVPDPQGGHQAPHLNLVVQARGMLNPVFTRAYFADDPTNETDRVLQSVPPDRRATLVATRHDDVDGRAVYELDIHLQGPDEMVFLDV